jgi:hypothetical protein
MVTLIAFVAGLVGKVGSNIAGETNSVAGQAAVAQIIATMPGDIGVMIVGLLTGMAGLMTAVGGLF